MIELTAATDDHFTWMIRANSTEPFGALVLPEGGVDDPAILLLLQANTASMNAACGFGTWLISTNNVVAGLCGFKATPDRSGRGEIGYGVSPAYRGRGIATDAVRTLARQVSPMIGIEELVADTPTVNLPSQRVLAKVGFEQVGCREDKDDGALLIWKLKVSTR